MEMIPHLQKLWSGISIDFVATTQGTLKTDISNLPPQANSWHHESSLESTQSSSCKVILHEFGFKIFDLTSFLSPCTPLGSEALPKGIVSPKSDLEMVPLWGSPRGKVCY
ncbi:hypothetical protein GW17_00001060 [Ensete ventricosum]|nr:hypothetical protein GW17_00001060 [Ensete ventricosum]